MQIHLYICEQISKIGLAEITTLTSLRKKEGREEGNYFFKKKAKKENNYWYKNKKKKKKLFKTKKKKHFFFNLFPFTLYIYSSVFVLFTYLDLKLSYSFN